MGDLSPHFSRFEFFCPCCGKGEPVPRLVTLLEHLRERVGRPVKITSGYRCPKHNAAVGGVTDSPHLQNVAAALAMVDSGHRFALVEAALAVGFQRVGLYRGKKCVHVDVAEAPNFPRPALWVWD